MAVNHILMRGSGFSAWEWRPSHNLSAQLPFSNYFEGCSGCLSKEKVQTKTHLPEIVRMPARVYSSKVGWVFCLNAGATLAHKQFNKITQEVLRPERLLTRQSYKGKKPTSCKVCNIYRFRMGLITPFTVLKWLKTASLARAATTYALAIWMTVKHMLASAVSSQDQLSSATNICSPTMA